MIGPRVMHTPGVVSAAGGEAIELAELAGLRLDDWQQLVLRHALAEGPDGRFAPFEVGVNVPRQNGKGGIIEARELAGLFLLGEQLIIHSAHQFDTSLEAFRRLLDCVEGTPELSKLVKRVSRAHGEEGIELTTGQRVRFRTRTKGGGRGFTGDCLILDEAMILPEATTAALVPTLAARPNAQIWYLGSAVDQQVHLDGLVWARVRERGIAGVDPRLAYFEWSGGVGDPRDDHPSRVDALTLADPATWELANPAFGIRISRTHVESEVRALDPRSFAVERLGVGDWPDTSPVGSAVIPQEAWSALADPVSEAPGSVVFAFDVSPDRTYAAIAAAGVRADGLVHVEIVDHREGVRWLVDRLRGLVERHAHGGVICDARSPAAAYADDVGAERVSAGGMADACGRFYDLVGDGGLRHRECAGVATALRGATKRPIGDAWGWSRRSSIVDITPLVAATLAVGALHTGPGEPGAGVDDILDAVFA